MTTNLTATQNSILTHAHHHTEGRIIWFPDNVKGGARNKVLDGLFNRALITACKGDWYISAEGYDALGVPHREPITVQALDTVIAGAEQVDTPPRRRENSKQAQVIALLKRPEGATIAQIMDVTGWQAHSIRGLLTAQLKKQMRLEIKSTKEQNNDRVYKIQ